VLDVLLNVMNLSTFLLPKSLYCVLMYCDGEPKTYFLLIDHVDSKAKTIKKAIVSYWQNDGVHSSAITSFGSDGANVMVGCVSDVVMRLQWLNPQVVSIYPCHIVGSRICALPSCFQEILTSINFCKFITRVLLDSVDLVKYKLFCMIQFSNS